MNAPCKAHTQNHIKPCAHMLTTCDCALKNALFC